MVSDINECKDTPNICGANGECQDTTGHYKCNCGRGYMFDKHTCKSEFHQPNIHQSIYFSINLFHLNLFDY